jgi:hypothetical protein
MGAGKGAFKIGHAASILKRVVKGMMRRCPQWRTASSRIAMARAVCHNTDNRLVAHALENICYALLSPQGFFAFVLCICLGQYDHGSSGSVSG